MKRDRISHAGVERSGKKAADTQKCMHTEGGGSSDCLGHSTLSQTVTIFISLTEYALAVTEMK